MSIKGNALIREILEFCQFKTDDQAPQNEDGNRQRNKRFKKIKKTTKVVRYCDLTGVPLN